MEFSTSDDELLKKI